MTGGDGVDVRHVPVAVIGAGPTGVTAATLLAQYGIDSVVLDRWSGVYPQPRAVHLDDEVYRIIARLGIAGEFAAISRPALGLRLLDRNLDVLAEFTRDPGVGVHGFPQASMFDQPELETLLRANLDRYPQSRILGDLEVIDIDIDAQGPVRITAVGRDDGRRHTMTADYVLGCDGANSLARRVIGSNMRDLRFAQRWLVVDVDTTADLQQWEGVHQLCDPHRAATYMRIGDRRYRWEFRLIPDESADDYATIEALEPLIRPWIPRVALADLRLVRVTEYTFRAQLADRWRKGPVFLLGDAAHLTPPFVGQGMGAGLRDAMNLAWKLAGVLNGQLPAAVLDTYEEERKPHARRMIALALNVGRAMTAGGELGRLARRVVVPRLHLIPGLRSRVLNSETPALRGSGLKTTSWRRRAPIGRLCPNLILHNGSRLDECLGAGFGLLSSEPLTAAQRESVVRRGAVHVTGGDVAAWLHRHHATAAVVRPDRTVVRTGTDPGVLCEALPHFHVPATVRRVR